MSIVYPNSIAALFSSRSGAPIYCVLTYRTQQCNYRTRFRWSTSRISWRQNYLINVLCKLGLGLGLDLELHHFSNYLRRITKTSILSSSNFTNGNILLKDRTQTINNTIKLHILVVPVHKLDN